MTEIVASQTPPLLHGPSEKERKYDRQLRLWAASGQAALEAAHVLVVNSGGGAVVTETLKNLILPGIGRFTIYDEAVVEEADLGVNFFLDEASLGRPRAQCCAELLLELNPEVQGDWHPKRRAAAAKQPKQPRPDDADQPATDEAAPDPPLDPLDPLDLAQLLATAATPFTMILYAQPIAADAQAQLEAYAQEHKTPVISVHTAGFYAFFRMRLPGAFPIVDTHPDETATADLRLLAPWPELAAYAEELAAPLDDAHADAHAHGHVPYVAILLHYLGQWRAAHGGADPATYKEKTAFRALVAAGARRDNAEGGEENFDEAAAAVLRNLDRPTLPPGLRQVFAYEPQGFERKSGFWAIAQAVKQFYEKHGCLPLSGKVPDMKAESRVYVRLQRLYKDKARRDADEVLATVRAMPGGEAVDAAEVDLFCKNAAFVKLINATAPGEDRLAKVVDDELASDAVADATLAPLSLVPIYLALQATAHAHAPAGAADEPLSAAAIVAGIERLAPGAGQHARVVQAAEELARTGGGELHNMAALTGGMVAQEMIKIITKQYVPIDNTCIFDGIGSRCQVVCL